MGARSKLKLLLPSFIGLVVVGAMVTPAAASPGPQAPCCLITDEITPHTIDLFWGASPDAVAYQVYVDGAQWTQFDPHDRPWNTFATLRHLPFNTSFTIEVRAVDAAGRLSAPATITARTNYYHDTIAPSAPTNLHVSASPFGPPVAGCPKYLRWTAGVDNYNDTMGDSEVYRDGVLVHVVRRGGQDTRGLWAYIGQDAPGPHTYTVKTLDQGGNTSPASAPLTVTFDGC